MNAYKRVKGNKGSSGVDGISIGEYEKNLSSNLYKIWNRMSSGSYFPKPVKLVQLPKSGGGLRPLGIPTVEDRVAQMAAVLMLNPILSPLFHEYSYGFSDFQLLFYFDSGRLYHQQNAQRERPGDISSSICQIRNEGISSIEPGRLHFLAQLRTSSLSDCLRQLIGNFQPATDI